MSEHYDQREALHEAQKEREQRPCMKDTAGSASNVGCTGRPGRTHCAHWWQNAAPCCACGEKPE